MIKTIKSLIYLLLIAVASLIPFWLYLGARNLINPEGFLAEFFVFGVGVWLLGGMQIVLLIVGFVAGYFVLRR